MFDYVPSVRSGQPEPCTRAAFERLIDLPAVARLCAQVAELADYDAARHHRDIAALKRRLPAFCFYATYGGRPRQAANARPSGLAYLDLDHVAADPRRHWADRLAPAAQAAGVWDDLALVHVTPSAHGLRIVFRMREADRSVADAQRRMARALGAETYDAVCHDLARASFAVPRSHLLHYVPALLFDDEAAQAGASDVKQRAAQADAVAANANANADRTDTDADEADQAAAGKDAEAGKAEKDAAPQEYQGIALSRIVEARLRQLVPGYRGSVPQGVRNTTYHRLACELRHLTDFRADWLLALLPPMDLDEAERRQCIDSALRAERRQGLPRALSQAIADLRTEGLSPAQRDLALLAHRPATFDAATMPRFFQLLCKPYPDDFHPAVVLAALPMLGTLATRLRTTYLDGERHSPSFMTCIVATQASGKSFVRNLSALLLEPLRQRDRAATSAEQAYLTARRQAKNRKEQPTDPRAPIRLLLPTISNAMLYKRLDCARGLHCYFEAEELDTVAKAEGAGSWSAKSDLYRQAFDNAEGGQQYMSETSWTYKGPIYLNWVACATPLALRRFFRNPEDGLVSRTCFCTLGDQWGKALARRAALAPAEVRYVQARCQALDQLAGAADADPGAADAKPAGNGAKPTPAKADAKPDAPDAAPTDAAATYDLRLPALDDAIATWLEDRRRDYNADPANYALDIFRRRAAVIGHRAGALAYLVATGAETRASLHCDFAQMVADLVLEMQLLLFGKQLNEIVVSSQQDLTPAAAASLRGHNGGMQRRERNQRLYDALPSADDAPFTLDDLRRLMLDAGWNAQPEHIVRRWLAESRIQRIDRHTWRKVAKGNASDGKDGNDGSDGNGKEAASDATDGKPTREAGAPPETARKAR